ncbi:conserved oligomeric Golgi complex subunit 1 isoform X1 [Diorhabda sublineata]|uniref:conserved oligomeric Golgi complex subunit 1 isoform X1 n=1 Tax=Diorhabda sublineata TaxID=1163346 RepID=UPI0024E0C2F7|nr:conserved oligomeric Golgi complex subunit 1 isoform X1 [Diorhabda sublineata]
MAKNHSNFLELDIEKLFEEHGIDEIVEIEKALDAEIERKRKDLRSMVGDRYKDVLAASDAIKSMKTISQDIVRNVEQITITTSEQLIQNPSSFDNKHNFAVDSLKIEERTVISRINLAIFINEQIWISLDGENNLDAVQYYLLAQHIHTGISLSKKQYIDRVPLLQQIKSNLLVLRSKIFDKITKKLESVETSAKDTSENLNALLLLENQSSDDLVNIFIEHRKTALTTVINTPYSSVRAQICSMVKCLMTTIRLLHECFISVKNGFKGLIWQQLQEIVGNTAPSTLSKLELPITPLNSYIPEIIKQFKPKCKFSDHTEMSLKDTETVLNNWMESTQKMIKDGLEKSLDLVPNIRGLHLTREESLKIEPPDNWNEICKDSHLPDNFDIWYYFFQKLITQRCKNLITKKISSNISEIQKDLRQILDTAAKSEKSETDLRWYTWSEDMDDISKIENAHLGLSMKTKGHSQNIVGLCKRFDKKYLELLEDASQYLYGKEYSTNFTMIVKDFKFKRKYMDKTDIEKHLQIECTKTCVQLSNYCINVLIEETSDLVTKSIILARFVQAITQSCLNFYKCCTFSNSEDWLKICDNFNNTSHKLWSNWINDVLKATEEHCLALNDISPKKMLKILSRWDEIEIQEHTEEKVFKSHIHVPLKPSLILNDILEKLIDTMGLKIPHTIPKSIHMQYIQNNMMVILTHYMKLTEKELNQKQALQFLFDVKFLTTLCIPRENVQLVSYSQDICDKFRSRIDPFDLDVFYSYLLNNVKKAVAQSQAILGCLLPSTNQLSSLGKSEKSKEDQNPNLLALSVPSMSTWFPLLPVSAPLQRLPGSTTKNKEPIQKSKAPKKPQDPTSIMKQSAASLFGGLTSDWFS